MSGAGTARSLFRRKNPRDPTAPGYELRSKGPAFLGLKALDNLVSASRRSSSSTTSAATSPTPTAVSQPSPMAEPSNADLLALIKSLTESVASLQTSVAELKQANQDMGSFGHQLPPGPHHDWPPRFQKLDFPRYDGKSDPLVFINRCESYFHQQLIAEEEKVWMASYNLVEGAQLWHSIVEALHRASSPSIRTTPALQSPGELMACHRTTTVVDYQERYEALLPRAGPLTEGQRVQIFTAGLLPPLSLDVEAHNPQSLAVAMSLAHKLELRDQYTRPPQSSYSSSRYPSKGLLPVPAVRLALTAPVVLAAQTTTAVEGRPVRRLSQTEMEDRRRQGLCFNCNEKFVQGHNRVCQRLFLVDLAEPDDTDDALPTYTDPAEPLISLHALTGVRTSETMQVQLRLGDDLILVALLDSGSTHNFISEETVRIAALPLDRREDLRVTVANGERVPCTDVLRATCFSIDAETFRADLYVLPLAGYNVVLGTQWPILWDFRALTMIFWRHDHQQNRRPPLQSAAVPPSRTPFSPSLLEFLPSRRISHRPVPATIASPWSQVPSLSWCAQERAGTPMCLNVAPRAHPSQLVRPDGSWRFCVDYRALNALTVKDAFPIPVVDELIDELRGARFFTKLDLHSGYHQGLYEFLVMPFGLCNAPATFQALMNDVLHPFLCRFVLIFFDDNISNIFRHQLFIKHSKCAFGVDSIHYLGHNIRWRSSRELIGLMHAVRHWRPYLWGRRFTIRTDHYSLKYLLDQRLTTIPQHHWVGKLLGFDFTVVYKPGATNIVADALSRRVTEEGLILATSRPRFDFIDHLRHAQHDDPALVALRDEITAGTRATPWAVVDGMVTYDGRLYISPASPLLAELVAATHEDGHEGVQRTLHRLQRDFHSPNFRRLVQDFIRACSMCQRYKSEHLHPAGLLLPLPVPSLVWADLGLDLIEALPKVGGKSVILTVVDRFSKYCHFIPLSHPYTAKSVAQVFFAEIVRLHGIPQSLVSDRDPVFTSAFWHELMRLMGTKLHMTTAFHPQSDGQTEAANKIIVVYLRCFTGDCPRQWIRWLPWAEYVYNTAFQASLKDTPFKVVYGRDPPSIRSYEPGETRVAAVAKTMADRDEFLADVHYRLEEAQAVQKKFYDKGHRMVTYAVGDWVWLRLRHLFPASLPTTTSAKLKPRYYGPYRVIELINDVAVRLALPERARLHDVFHVGLLKKFVGAPPDAPPALPPILHGAVLLEPERAEKSRLARGVHQILVHWKDQPASAATWADVDSFVERYPSFQLEDKLLIEEGRAVMWGRHYVMRRHRQESVPATPLLALIEECYESNDLMRQYKVNRTARRHQGCYESAFLPAN
nr:unnamed protein product [Digitaria exilis]